MMNDLLIPGIETDIITPDLLQISKIMDDLNPRHKIDKISWGPCLAVPEVYFKVAYTSDGFLLKYYVSEQSIRAKNSGTNQPVYHDSCVEFFVMPAEDEIYYNFEFNCIGACLAQVGYSREDRSFLEPGLIKNIKRQSSLEKNTFEGKTGFFEWELTILIPFEVFINHQFKAHTGKQIKANFYKCGDRLPEPHYLSWKTIGTKTPDFHRPDFFGILEFE